MTTNKNWLYQTRSHSDFFFFTKLYYYQVIDYEELIGVGKRLSFCPQWVAQHCASRQSSGFYRLLWSSSHQSLTELLLVLLKVEHNIILLCCFTNDYKCTFLPAVCKNTLSEWYLFICGHSNSIWSDIRPLYDFDLHLLSG